MVRRGNSDRDTGEHQACAGYQHHRHRSRDESAHSEPPMLKTCLDAVMHRTHHETVAEVDGSKTFCAKWPSPIQTEIPSPPVSLTGKGEPTAHARDHAATGGLLCIRRDHRRKPARDVGTVRQ